VRPQHAAQGLPKVNGHRQVARPGRVDRSGGQSGLLQPAIQASRSRQFVRAFLDVEGVDERLEFAEIARRLADVRIALCDPALAS
jgi:hypothetical protein